MEHAEMKETQGTGHRNLWRLGAVETAAAIRDRQHSCEEVVASHVERMRAVNPPLNAVTIDLGDEALDAAADYGFIPSPKSLRAEWDARIDAIFAEAQLERQPCPAITGGRQGRHGEQMGFLLADLQYVQRTFPGLTW